MNTTRPDLERYRAQCEGKILIPHSLLTTTMAALLSTEVVRCTGKAVAMVPSQFGASLLELVRACQPLAVALTAPLFRDLIKAESRIADHFGRVLVLPDHETGQAQIYAAGAYVLDSSARGLFTITAPDQVPGTIC